MKIKLIVVGKTTTDYIRTGYEIFEKRVKHYAPFETIVIPDLKSTRGLSAEVQKQREGQLILDAAGTNSQVILLDERGSQPTSREFASYIDRKMASLSCDIVFVVGGPYGFSPEVYARANDRISLSRMTFPHELVRLFFIEQIYRAFTILRGEPYHHD